ncbi:MAG: cytochrome c oxidase assembly protein [Acidimicrobiales bacterium]
MAPLGVLAVVGALLTILAFDRRPTRSRRASSQSLLAFFSWSVLWAATSSSFARRGMTNLPDHMIGHVLVMFLVPMGLIFSGYARSLWWILGVQPRRRLLRWWYVRRSRHLPSWVLHPFTATVLLNIVMVASHTPRFFDFAMAHQWAMDWVMEPAFLLSGLFFFHFLLSAPPRRTRIAPGVQAAMIVVTMFEMFVLAMSMSIFTKASWYSVMVPGHGMPFMPGMATSVSAAFHQQQLAAAILWICSDFWAVPILVVIARRLVTRDGSLFAVLERQSSRFSGVAD